MLRVGASSKPHRRAQEARLALVYTFRLSCVEFAQAYQRRLEYVLRDYADRGYLVDAALALRVLHNIRDQDPFNRMPVKATQYYS